jgi:hypothetical protein
MSPDQINARWTELGESSLSVSGTLLGVMDVLERQRDRPLLVIAAAKDTPADDEADKRQRIEIWTATVEIVNASIAALRGGA